MSCHVFYINNLSYTLNYGTTDCWPNGCLFHATSFALVDCSRYWFYDAVNPNEENPDEDNIKRGYKTCKADSECKDYWKQLEEQTPDAIPCVNKWKNWKNCYKVDLGNLYSTKPRNNGCQLTNKIHRLKRRWIFIFVNIGITRNWHEGPRFYIRKSRILVGHGSVMAKFNCTFVTELSQCQTFAIWSIIVEKSKPDWQSCVDKLHLVSRVYFLTETQKNVSKS